MAAEKAVTLNWLPSASLGVKGYRIYYGPTSGRYTNNVDAGSNTSGSVCCLSQGQTYFFAVTAYLATGEESEFSEEVSYRVKDPVNVAPKLNAISDIVLDEDADAQTVLISGIQAGAANETQPLTVTVTSSDPSLIPNPRVDYVSPSPTALLYLKPRANTSGTATISVTVDDGQLLNNRSSQLFHIRVNPINDPPQLDPVADVTLAQNSQAQSISLSGISSGAFNEAQTLTITATSSAPTLIPHPTVRYSSPDATAVLSFTSTSNSSGIAIITVTVDDGDLNNNRISRDFQVEILPTPTKGLLLEAESGVFTEAMEQGASTSASGGSFAFSRTPEQGTLGLSFFLEQPGDYTLWARGMAVDSSSDSFYLTIDENPESIFYLGLQTWSQDWQWAELKNWTFKDNLLSSSPRLLRLTKGQHTLKFRCREAFTMLDAVYLSAGTEFPEPELSPNFVSESNLESPWRASSIGIHPAGQSVVVDSGAFVLSSDGMLQGSRDNCLFINQDGQDDSQITAVMDVPAQLGEGGFAGIMIRGDLGSRSVYAALGVSSNRALQWNVRRGASLSSDSMNVPLDESITRCWLHLRRNENTISGYASLNGVVWFPIQDIELLMPSSVQLGLVFASGESPVSVTFSDVSVAP